MKAQPKIKLDEEKFQAALKASLTVMARNREAGRDMERRDLERKADFLLKELVAREQRLKKIVSEMEKYGSKKIFLQ